ncbi:MAG: transcription elongation factor Spt5 [Promethearchaeota archaeon Loki_b32]|nr:MAG: transcription elongation factor Spt5 [Candidatus Lokiarchaeota archaeon Loki_b32]
MLADQEEDPDRSKSEVVDITEVTVKGEDKEDHTTTLFAVRTTINQESNILKQIFYRFKILDVIPDIRAMLISPLLPGYVFFEAPQKRSVQIAVQGIPHIKGRIVQNIKLIELKHVLLPRSVTEYLEEGDTVEIISGVFEGSRALVMRMPHDTSSSEEVVVRLLQEETPITIKIHGDYLKLVEKKKPIDEPIPKVKASVDTTTDMEKAISFEDELEEFEEEISESYKSDEIEEYTDDEEELEEEDEWAKFDGF